MGTDIPQVVDQTKDSPAHSQASEASRNLLADASSPAASGKSTSGDVNTDSTNRISSSYISADVLEGLAKAHPDRANVYRKTIENLNAPRTQRFAPRSDADGSNAAREVFDAQNELDLPGVKVRSEGQPASGNASVDKVYEMTGIVRDFYKQNYNRDSIDDRGMTMISTVNFTDQPGQPMLNAFWNGKQMAYGNPGPTDEIATFLLLDIAGHEITHGVSQPDANLGGWGQAGALNESNSDVFGEQIKQWNEHLTSDKGHWIGAEGFWKPGEGVRRGLRDLNHPGNAFNAPDIGKDSQPSNMRGYQATVRDCGGVHANAGIPTSAFSHFAIDLAKAHPDDDEKRFSYKEPGHIWYEARRAAGSDPSFAEMAFHTIDQAQKLGFGDDVPLLQKAWAGVGVTPARNAPDIATPEPRDPRCR